MRSNSGVSAPPELETVHRAARFASRLSADGLALIIGGFPYKCFDNLCETKVDCIMYGCVKGHGHPPRKA